MACLENGRCGSFWERKFMFQRAWGHGDCLHKLVHLFWRKDMLKTGFGKNSSLLLSSNPHEKEVKSFEGRIWCHTHTYPAPLSPFLLQGRPWTLCLCLLCCKLRVLYSYTRVKVMVFFVFELCSSRRSIKLLLVMFSWKSISWFSRMRSHFKENAVYSYHSIKWQNRNFWSLEV